MTNFFLSDLDLITITEVAVEPEVGQDPMKLMETEAAEDTTVIEDHQEANIMATKAQTLI